MNYGTCLGTPNSLMDADSIRQMRLKESGGLPIMSCLVLKTIAISIVRLDELMGRQSDAINSTRAKNSGRGNRSTQQR